MSAKVSLSIYGCLVFLTGEVRLPCGNNLLAIFISFQGFILVGFWKPKNDIFEARSTEITQKMERDSIFYLWNQPPSENPKKTLPPLNPLSSPSKKPKTSPPISCVCQAMDSQTTETKTPLPSRSKVSEICKSFENLNPNLSSPSPAGLKKIANSQGEMEPSGPLSAGRVAHLVEAFERLLKDEYGSNNNQSRCVKNQAFGGRAAEKQVSSSWDNSLPACFSEKSDISTLVPR